MTGPIAHLISRDADPEAPRVRRTAVAEPTVSCDTLAALVRRAVAVVVDFVATLGRRKTRNRASALQHAGTELGPGPRASAGAAAVEADTASHARRRIRGNVDERRARVDRTPAIRDGRVEARRVRRHHGVGRDLSVRGDDRDADLSARRRKADPDVLRVAREKAIHTAVPARRQEPVVPVLGLVATPTDDRSARRRQPVDRGTRDGVGESEREKPKLLGHGLLLSERGRNDLLPR